MSEKRFAWDGDILFDNLELRELGNCLEARDIADLLNKLHEENEQLEKGKMEALSLLGEEIDKNEQLRRDNKFLRNERRLQEKAIFTSFDEINKLNKENENLKRDHRIMVEQLYIISKDYIKDVGDDDEC